MRVDRRLSELEGMKKYPKNLYYRGRLDLLERPKVSIVGSRRASQYALQSTYKLAGALAKAGAVVVSGGAMGVDAAAHRGAGPQNSVCVLPCGIDLKYPAINGELIEEIGSRGLLLSQFEPGFKATPWSFVARNELVVALGEVLVVTEAAPKSGSIRSVEFAKEMGKKIYVLPHRLKESEGTNMLLLSGEAEAIYDLEAFAEIFTDEPLLQESDPFIEFCLKNPTYEEALEKFGERLFEAELEGKICVVNGRIVVRG